MNDQSDRQPSEEFLRFKNAVRKIATLTPEEQAEVERKIKEDAKKLYKRERPERTKS